MSKFEKTLELNITHEILTLAEAFEWALHDITLWKYWSPQKSIVTNMMKKPIAVGLPLTLEGRAGGGWDVKIEYPGETDRAAFLQFKSGTPRGYCLHRDSIFRKDNSDPEHLEFTFNNNANKNQHQLLRELSTSPDGQNHAVLYAFPRLKAEDVQYHLGRLCLITSFISVTDLDQKAAAAKKVIEVGKVHKFRACYRDYYRNEVNFFFFFFDGPDRTPNFLAELVCIRVMRALRHLREFQLSGSAASEIIRDAFVRVIFYYADYCVVDLSSNSMIDGLIESTAVRKAVSKKISDFRSKENISLSLSPNQQRGQLIFETIIKALNPFFNLCDSERFATSEVPTVSATFSMQILRDGIRIPLSERVGPEDSKAIKYMLF